MHAIAPTALELKISELRTTYPQFNSSAINRMAETQLKHARESAIKQQVESRRQSRDDASRERQTRRRACRFYKRFNLSIFATPEAEIHRLNSGYTANFLFDLAGNPPCTADHKRARDTARYADPAWRAALSVYLDYRRQLREAKAMNAAAPKLDGAKPWSAWSRYVKAMQHKFDSIVRRLTKECAAAKKALGAPMYLWKRRR